MDNWERSPLTGETGPLIPDVRAIPLEVVLGSGPSDSLENAVSAWLQTVLRPADPFTAHSSTT
jgi:hypothetical protein